VTCTGNDSEPVLDEASESPEIVYEEDDVRGKLYGVVDVLMNFFPSDPQEFGKAVDAVHRSACALSTTSSVVSALHNFGKAPSAASLLAHGHSHASIPVQPVSAVARRKSHFASRQCTISGRPPNCSIIGEHSYGIAVSAATTCA